MAEPTVLAGRAQIGAELYISPKTASVHVTSILHAFGRVWHGPSLNHLGVEVADTGAVDADQVRLAEAGLAFFEERDTTCCYARQDKFWVKGAPSEERWEIYRVLEDSATFWGQYGGQSRDGAEAALGTAPGGQAAASAGQGSPCCGGRQAGRPAGQMMRPPVSAARDRTHRCGDG
jgi:hypothetical protein